MKERYIGNWGVGRGRKRKGVLYESGFTKNRPNKISEFWNEVKFYCQKSEYK